MKHSDFDRINRLNERQYEILRRLGNGDSVGEISMATGKSRGSVTRQIQRIKQRLDFYSTERARAFATRFVVFDETQTFRFIPGGQAELFPKEEKPCGT